MSYPIIVTHPLPLVDWKRSLLVYLYTPNIFYHLHAVLRTQQGRQREPSVKTLRSPLYAEFWRHCVLSRGIQRRYSHTLVPLGRRAGRDGLYIYLSF